MAKEVKKKLDFNQLAKSIVDRATEKEEEKRFPEPKETKKKTASDKK